MFKKVCVAVNNVKDPMSVHADRVIDCLSGKGFDIELVKDIKDYKDVFNSCDMIFSLGGDGTFIQAARVASVYDVPVIGVNLGTLGYLTEIELCEMEKSIDRICAGEYRLEKRILIEGSIIRKGQAISTDIALNDIVISRANLSRILHLSLYIDEKLADVLPGDGLIISTPTGSTAYSLSAGGPIVEPETDLILITPICPHLLHSRSYIATGDRTVKVFIEEEYVHECFVTFDGQTGYPLRGGDTVQIKRSSNKVTVVRLGDRNFYSLLRKKIYQRGES